MGLFSKCCAKTHLPVLYGSPHTMRTAARLAEIVVLTRHEEPYPAVYDGYGLGLVDEWDEVKFVLKDAYAGERYDDLPPSEDEPNQGYFFSEEFILALKDVPSLPSHEVYEDLLRAADDIYEEVLKACLQEVGLVGEAKDYEITRVLETAREVLEDPGMEILRERYAQARTKTPVLQAMFPQDPAACKALVDAFFPRMSQRQSERYAALLQPYRTGGRVSSTP